MIDRLLRLVFKNEIVGYGNETFFYQFVGTPTDVNLNKFVSEQLYEIDVYSPTKGASLSLVIESNGTELCRTKKFQTRSQGHVFVHSSDLLHTCDRHQIENKTATIRLISYSSSDIQIGNAIKCI